MKLNQDQIKALRNVSPELADKLEAGESVTVEREVKRWEPAKGWWIAGIGGWVSHRPFEVLAEWVDHGVTRKNSADAQRLADDQRIFNRLHAYREEFAPGYVVPDVGGVAWLVEYNDSREWYADWHRESRSPTVVYMPKDVAEDLASKLNSGEVVL